MKDINGKMRWKVTGKGCTTGKGLSEERTFELSPQKIGVAAKSCRRTFPAEGMQRQRGRKALGSSERKGHGWSTVRRMILGECREKSGARLYRAWDAMIRVFILF